jgi:phage terminase large subunit
VSVTKRSINGIKEYRNYMWLTDKDGRILNVPIDLWNHFLDAVRYGNESLRPSTAEPRVKRSSYAKRRNHE